MNERVFQSKYGKLPGTSLEEVMKLARAEYHAIQKRSPRRTAYVRSKYFSKNKVFLNTFWEHLNQKSPKERVERLKLYSCAIDLLRNSAAEPESFYTNTDTKIGLHRFYGRTKDGNHCKASNKKAFRSVARRLRPKVLVTL